MSTRSPVQNPPELQTAATTAMIPMILWHLGVTAPKTKCAELTAGVAVVFVGQLPSGIRRLLWLPLWGQIENTEIENASTVTQLVSKLLDITHPD